MKPIEFNGPERSASAFFYFASRSVPVKVKKVHHFEDIEKWVKEVNEDITLQRKRTFADHWTSRVSKNHAHFF